VRAGGVGRGRATGVAVMVARRAHKGSAVWLTPHAHEMRKAQRKRSPAVSSCAASFSFHAPCALGEAAPPARLQKVARRARKGSAVWLTPHAHEMRKAPGASKAHGLSLRGFFLVPRTVRPRRGRATCVRTGTQKNDGTNQGFSPDGRKGAGGAFYVAKTDGITSRRGCGARRLARPTRWFR